MLTFVGLIVMFVLITLVEFATVIQLLSVRFVSYCKRQPKWSAGHERFN